MTTTLELSTAGASTYTTALGKDVVFERVLGKGGTVRGMKVFRTGKFRDSLNRPHEWTAEDLAKLVAHFSELRDSGIFPHVPVRQNHGRDAGSVVGYVDKLSIDGKWLVADLEITESSAADKIENKTFRNRSLEVGSYVDNDDRSYNPTVLGVAFVDIGAVEGLFNGADQNPSYFIITENPMPEAVTFQQPQLDWAVAAAYAKGLEDAPKPTGNGDLAPFEFTYGGAKTADPKAVQAYINTLETAQAEQRDATRKSYVAALATAGKIPATQIDPTQAFVLTMSDAQFDQYKTINDVAPKLSRFEQQSDNGNGTPDPDDVVAQKIKDLEDTVAMHRRAGMSDADLKETASFQKLTELKNANK